MFVQVGTSQSISVTLTVNAEQIQYPDPLVEPLAHPVANPEHVLGAIVGRIDHTRNGREPFGVSTTSRSAWPPRTDRHHWAPARPASC